MAIQFPPTRSAVCGSKFFCGRALLWAWCCGVAFLSEEATRAQEAQLRPLPTDRLTVEDGVAGWIALFDGRTNFGFRESRVEDGPEGGTVLRGGETTSLFAEYELRVRVASPGAIYLGQEKLSLEPGEHTLRSRGPAGKIRLGDGLAISTLNLKPVGMKALFNGRDLTGWDRRGRVPPSDRPGAKWTWRPGVVEVRGGPEALEYAPANSPALFGDFLTQVVVVTRRADTNGGLFIRNEPGKTMMGYEIQLHHAWYDPAGSRHGYTTGGIDDRQQARTAVSADFVPCRVTVVAHGPHFATWVNGYQTADWTDTRAPHANPRQGQRLEPGTLQLQAHDPETHLEFHGVWIQEYTKQP